jgi:nucleoside-diphosphate-sugar epimerase
MKILLTGATGFIGTWAAQRLTKDGHEVVGMDLIAPEAGQVIPMSRFIRGDIRKTAMQFYHLPLLIMTLELKRELILKSMRKPRN